MADKNTSLPRDLSVGHDTTIGRKLDVKGRVSIGHSLTVSGWLDAPNIIGTAKGLFGTEAELKAAYPEPKEGWYAFVGTTLPAELYVVKDGVWTDTGKKAGEPTIKSDYLEGAVEDLQDGLDKETDERKTADEALQANLDKETKARTEADAALEKALATETDERTKADAEIQDTISELIYPTIYLDELDTLSDYPRRESIRYVVLYRRSGASTSSDSSEKLTAERIAGILDLLGDGWFHESTQVLTSHCALGDDGKLDTTGNNHTDAYVRQYYRSYSHGAPGLDVDEGTWTDWKPMNAEELETLESTLKTYTDDSIPQLIAGVVTSVDELPATKGEYYYVHDGADPEYLYLTYGKAGKGVPDKEMNGKVLYVDVSDNSLYRWKSGEGLIQIAGDLLHKSDVGVAGGVAPLDDNTLVDGSYLPKDIVNDVVEFDGFYDGTPSIQLVGISGGSILFCNSLNGFVAMKSGTFGNVWPDSEWYGELNASTKAVTPFVGKLYVDRIENVPYRWTGSGLVAVSVGMKEELARQEAEQQREEAEAARVAAEKARVSAENTRETNEEDRQAAEKARVANERSRAVSEADRSEHEEDRQAAEKMRVANEKTRIEETNAAITSANEAAKNVNLAVQNANAAAMNAQKATTDANNAATKATAATEKVEAAISGAEKVNANLDGNVLSVTNRNGETKTLDIEDLVTSEEAVTVQIKSTVSSVSVSGMTLAVYINHGTSATKYTTDSSGKATFSVPIGSYYEVHFPDFADARAISPVGYTATVPSRTIAVTYEAYEGEEETCYVEVKKHVSGAASVFEGVKVTVQVGDGTATTYTSDSNGLVTFTSPVGKTVTVTLEDLKGSGYYAHNGKLTRTFKVYLGGHTEHVIYYQFLTGVFIVDVNGVDYTLAQWTAAGKTKDDAELLKVVTENLVLNDAVAYIDPLAMSTRNFQTKQWCTTNVQFPSIPLNTQTYKGQEHTQLMLEDCEEYGYVSPAAEHVITFSKTIAGQTMTGYLGAANQWLELWANRALVDEILTALYGSSTKTLSSYTANKWTSDQISANGAYHFSSGVYNSSKNFTSAVVPFYAY